MNYVTKDSGAREVYDSGMMRDTQDGKPRFDLMIPEGVPYQDQLLTRFAALLARGAVKYGDRNWERGSGKAELDRARASAFRHFAQWFCAEQDEDHAAAVIFNLLQVETLRSKMRRSACKDLPSSTGISGISPSGKEDALIGSPLEDHYYGGTRPGWTPPPPRDNLIWAGVDLDGTLAEPVWTPGNPTSEIGNPIISNVMKLSSLVNAGYKVVIHTSRPWTDYEAIESWLNYHLIPWHHIQCGKPLYAIYIDDRGRHADAPTWLP